MNEILITQEPSAPIDIEAISGRVLTVTSPSEVYVPFIGDNGNWWVAGIDSGVTARGESGADADPATVAAIAESAAKAQAAAVQAQAEAAEAVEAARQSMTAAETAAAAADSATEHTIHAADAAAAAKQAAEVVAGHAATAGTRADAAEKAAADALAEAKAALNAAAALPDIVTGTAPCLKTGTFAFTRIYFPRRFAAAPQVVPGVRDLGGLGGLSAWSG